MGAGHGRLDVDGVITQPPQLQRFIQGSHHKQGIMAICGGDIKLFDYLQFLQYKVSCFKDLATTVQPVD